MTAKDVLNLELYALNIKYSFLKDYKLKHRQLLQDVQTMLSENTSLKIIKVYIKRRLKNIYRDVENSILELSKENFNLLTNTKYNKSDIFAMGLTLGEMIQSRINTHYKDIINQSLSDNQISMQKTKRKHLNVVTSMTTDYLKVTRNKAYAVIEKQSNDLIGWLYTAMLDRRTSTLCISLNNKFYSRKVYKSRGELPRIPNVSTHIHCRSILIPIYHLDEKKKYQNITLDEFIINDSIEARKLIGDRKYKLMIENKLDAKDIFDYRRRKFYTIKEIKESLKL